MFKKLLFSIVTAALLLQTTIVPVFAANWFDQSIYPWYTKVYDTQAGGSPSNEIFGERYTAAQVQWVIYSLIVVPMHMMFDSDFTACVLNRATSVGLNVFSCFTTTTGGASFVSKLIKALIVDSGVNQPQNLALSSQVFQDRPLSGITYTKNLLRKVTHVSEVKAQQGFGFGALNVVQEAWKKSRDVSYGLLIFAAIIMSFMIMMRTKISPQAVITAQSAIPQLIFAIILITFSFAIAGFMIDLMYVVIGIIATVTAPDAAGIQAVYGLMTNGGPGGGGLFRIMVGYSQLFSTFLMIAVFAGSGANNFLREMLTNNTFMVIVCLIAFTLAGLLLLFAFLKAIFMLIRTLVSIYLLVIFGPFYILGGTLSQSLGFGSWIKELISNLAVFPAVGVLFLYSMQFLKWGVDAYTSQLPQDLKDALNTYFLSTIGQASTPALNSGWSPPLLDIGGGGGMMLLFVSLSLMLLIPKVSDIIKGFMSGRPFSYGSGIGEAIGAPAVGFMAAYKGGTGIADEYRSRFAGRTIPFSNMKLPGTKKP